MADLSGYPDTFPQQLMLAHVRAGSLGKVVGEDVYSTNYVIFDVLPCLAAKPHVDGVSFVHVGHNRWVRPELVCMRGVPEPRDGALEVVARYNVRDGAVFLFIGDGRWVPVPWCPAVAV